MQFVTIAPYVYNKEFEERMETPPTDKLLIRIYYEPKYRIIPKCILRRRSKRYDFEMEPYDIPMLLKMHHKEFMDFIAYKAELGAFKRITKIKLRHTIGGIHSRFSITFTNHESIKYPTLRTESPNLKSRLPESITRNMKYEVNADMFGVNHNYEFMDGNLRVANYLKLMNYFDDDELKSTSIFIIPSTYVDAYFK